MRAALALVLALVAGRAVADCQAVRDPDLRACCEAQAEGRTYPCDSIRSVDLRTLCRAAVKGAKRPGK